MQYTSPVRKHLENDDWLSVLSYLADILWLLNDLNVSCRDEGVRCYQLLTRLTAFRT